MLAFEKALYALVRSIEYTSPKNEFLHRLKSDVKKIKESENVFVLADKTTNLYEVDKATYKKVMLENITKTYKKATEEVPESIDREASSIVEDLELGNRVDRYAKRCAYITFKDHKENFSNNLPCRLINPAKSEIGKISRKILQHHNEIIRNATGYQQWRETSSVIDWFQEIRNKKKCRFLSFDIKDYFPSITPEIFLRSLEWAEQYTNIDPGEIEIILHARKTLLFDQKDTWVKKKSYDLFDVTMGANDSSEFSDFVGLYLLSQLVEKFGSKNIGLYRDDGLAVLPTTSGPKAERARKDLVRLFKNNNFDITASTNLCTVDFLDVTFDLKESKFYPFRKENNTILYVNAESNHPPAVLKQIPGMVEKRISKLSCNEEEFRKAKPNYQEAIKRSGYDHELEYAAETKKRRKRSRKVIWFNPPFNANVKTKIGAIFLRMLKEYFPRHHKYYSIFNKNTIKVSYDCMENMEKIIKNHNSKILNEDTGRETETRTCNCRKKDSCPLEGKCLSKEIIYKAEVKTQSSANVYYGVCATTFKKRFANHKKSLNTQKYKEETALSKFIWELKDQNIQYEIAWSIHGRAPAYRCGTRKCSLCMAEKMAILQEDPEKLINKISDLVSWCPHRLKFQLPISS